MSNADQDVRDHMAGGPAIGDAFPEAKAAVLYAARMFGLSKDYAFPVNPQVQAARWDQITTLTKLLTRKMKMPDGNEYDIWDAVMTICKYVLTQNPKINDAEPNSVKAAK